MMGLFSGIGKVFKGVAKAAGGVLGKAVGGAFGYPVLGSVVGSGISGLIGDYDSRQAINAQNDFNSAQTAEQMAFQERMSNTAHQREVADLKAAGLNPVLSAMRGSGASSPFGSAAVQTGNEATISSSSNLARAQAEQARASTDLLGAQTMQATSQANLNAVTAREVEARIPTHAANIGYTQALISKVSPEIGKILSDTALNSVQYNRVLEEINNLIVTRQLDTARISDVLAHAGLSRAETGKVSYDIKRIISETQGNLSLLPEKRARGALGVLAKQGIDTISNARDAAANSDVGSDTYDFKESVTDFFKRNADLARSRRYNPK